MQAARIPRYVPLVALLDELRAREAELVESIEQLRLDLAEVRRAIAGVEGRLRSDYQSDNDKSMSTMHTLQRRKHSKNAGRMRPEVKRLVDMCLARGIASLHELAERMRDEGHPDDKLISQPYLSMAATGDGSMSMRRAKLIEKLIGIKATVENWPTLRLE